MSSRLHFVVEGQTEESFVNAVLRPHLADFQVWCDARTVHTSRQGPYWVRGGVTTYRRIRKDLQLWMKEDREGKARFTTMFDYYRWPKDSPRWMTSSPVASLTENVIRVEAAFSRDIDDPRFIPHLQLHEFEALILVDPAKLAVMYPGKDRAEAIRRLVELRDSSGDPEKIDLDHPPSWRILAEIPDYDKVSAAVVVTQAVGLDALRRGCRHFAAWLARLEALGSVAAGSPP